jgi:hypothetical protein
VICSPLFSYDEAVNKDKKKYLKKSDPAPTTNKQKFTELVPATEYNCSVSAQTSKGYGQSASLKIWTKGEGEYLL